MHDVAMRESLERLAEHDGGRRLLQLALRSIERGDHELVSGCWTRKGDAGCLFQHAYWQGVDDGVFADDGRARAWVTGVAGPQGYHRVIEVIAKLGDLGSEARGSTPQEFTKFLAGETAKWTDVMQKANIKVQSE